MLFAKVQEKEITRSILGNFSKSLHEMADAEVLVIGAGPSGLVASRELAKQGVKVFVIEQNNYLGGGMWLGGFMMNPITIREPGQEIFEELGVPLEEVNPGLYVADGPYANSKLIAATCEAGVKFLQLTSLEDVLVKDGRLCGVVVNWTPVQSLPHQITCVDPIVLQARIVIDATGHDAVSARRLEKRGLLKVKGMGVMGVEASEDAVVEHCGEVFPGLIVTGMAVSEIFGLPRMGPTFGAMLLSGKKAAQIALEKLGALAKV
ncbi:MAG: thiazole biosynthesis protein [Elusimicrobia bacterium]|nr:thiazole biosynthesis protein [Elusimicrobiota bacterium]